MAQLTELDTLEIRVLVNDQLDNIMGSWHSEVAARGLWSHIPLTQLDSSLSKARGDAKLELRLPNSCCGAHGLSLMITATAGDKQHTMLFDAGPEGTVWQMNVERLRHEDEIAKIEHVHLSHWHRDHSGGLQKAIEMIKAAKNRKSDTSEVIVDLHSNRPAYRGFSTPRGNISLEADPTFAELESAGARIVKHDDDHTVLGNMFLVSGEIPRTTAYEVGISNGVRLNDGGAWEADPLIKDERFVLCNLKGKGLVVFTGCSHAGVVNVSRRAVDLGAGVPLHAVVGGFHLSDADMEKLKSTVEDLKKLKPTVLMPGHCSGWRLATEAEKSMPGSVVPIYGGQLYELAA